MNLAKLPKVEIDKPSDWPPVLAFVRDYWQVKCGARRMPSRNDISPAELKTQLSQILIADVVDDGADFRYRLVGTRLRQFFQDEPSGRLMSDVLSAFGHHTVKSTVEAFGMVASRRAPVRLTGAGSMFGQNTKLFDAYLAPLSGDDLSVNMILGTFIFDWDRDQQFQPLLSAWSD